MIAVAAGILLGLFFRFYVLIPATLVLSLICLVTALSRGDQLADIMMTVLLPPVTLQVGYVFGLCLRDLVGKAPGAKRVDAAQTSAPRRAHQAEQQAAVALARTK